jgi:predicted membrane protein
MNEMNNMNKRSGNDGFTAGAILLIIGVALLFKAMGFAFAGWIFSWPSILMLIGIVALVNSNFKSGFGFFMLALGGYFMLKNFGFFPISLKPYLAPIILISLGIYFLVSRNLGGFMGRDFVATSITSELNQDSVQIKSAFSEVRHKVYSQKFEGGNVKIDFGGGELDLMNCDLAEYSVLNINVSFGGLKLIVPAHWTVISEVSNSFASIEDKRGYGKAPQDLGKKLILRGSVSFGGLELRSY